MYYMDLSPKNRSIALPLPEPDCRFSTAVFLSGDVPPGHVTRPVQRRAVWGNRGTQARAQLQARVQQ